MTKHYSTLAAAALVVLLPICTAFAETGASGGSADAGKAKAATCAACHGADGNSQNPAWPSLAGQHAQYVSSQLLAFKSGTRSDPLMSAQAMLLSDADILDLAAYFATQTATPRAIADESNWSAGEQLYRGGNKDNGTSACIACHGPSGRGNPAAAYPSVQGQHATYTTARLKAYAADERMTDSSQKIMRNIAATLDDADMLAVASYIQGLH